MSSDCVRVALLLSEISRSMGLLGVVWKTKKLASRTFIHDRRLFKAQAIKDKKKDADHIVFQMICKSVV